MVKIGACGFLVFALASTCVAAEGEPIRQLDARIVERFADQYGKVYCHVTISNRTDRVQKFKVWSEYSTNNAGIWHEFSIPESYGLRAHGRQLFELQIPATWMYRIVLKPPDLPAVYVEPGHLPMKVVQTAEIHCKPLK